MALCVPTTSTTAPMAGPPAPRAVSGTSSSEAYVEKLQEDLARLAQPLPKETSVSKEEQEICRAQARLAASVAAKEKAELLKEQIRRAENARMVLCFNSSASEKQQVAVLLRVAVLKLELAEVVRDNEIAALKKRVARLRKQLKKLDEEEMERQHTVIDLSAPLPKKWWPF